MNGGGGHNLLILPYGFRSYLGTIPSGYYSRGCYAELASITKDIEAPVTLQRDGSFPCWVCLVKYGNSLSRSTLPGKRKCAYLLYDEQPSWKRTKAKSCNPRYPNYCTRHKGAVVGAKLGNSEAINRQHNSTSVIWHLKHTKVKVPCFHL